MSEDLADAGAHYHVEYPRTVPASRPSSHRPAAPRFSLRWRRPVPEFITVWFGLQGADATTPEGKGFTARMRSYFEENGGPDSFEVFDCVETPDMPGVAVVAYWTTYQRYETWLTRSAWRGWWDDAERVNEGLGYWREELSCPYDRHETIYSDPEYRIGLGLTSDSVIVPITTNGYFGAARDRIPLSAINELPGPDLDSTIATFTESGRRVMLSVPENVTVLRSGQYWHTSEPEQADDYEQMMQPLLDRGMDYLQNNSETGCLSLRRLTNLTTDHERRRETSILATFRSLDTLEQWSAAHHTHLSIYRHAIAMKRKYGARRDVVTWHELFVLPHGNRFEYLNCHETTGLLPLLSPNNPGIPINHSGESDQS